MWLTHPMWKGTIFMLYIYIYFKIYLSIFIHVFKCLLACVHVHHMFAVPTKARRICVSFLWTGVTDGYELCRICGRAAFSYNPWAISLCLMLYILEHCIILASVKWLESINLCKRSEWESKLWNYVLTRGLWRDILWWAKMLRM